MCGRSTSRRSTTNKPPRRVPAAPRPVPAATPPYYPEPASSPSVTGEPDPRLFGSGPPVLPPGATRRDTGSMTAADATLRLGRHEVWPPVVLAPMAGITNIAFRRLCRELSAVPAAGGTRAGGLYVCE